MLGCRPRFTGCINEYAMILHGTGHSNTQCLLIHWKIVLYASILQSHLLTDKLFCNIFYETVTKFGICYAK